MNLNTEIVGHGPQRVIALHDWTSTRDTYEVCRPFFDTDRFTYALPDLRGYGGSLAYTGAYSSEEVAADIRDTASALGWESYHLVGHSMTGMPSLRATKEQGAAVRSLVLVTPIPASGLPVDGDGRKMFEASARDDMAFDSITKLLSSGRLPQAWYRRKRAQQRATISAEAYLGYLNMWTKEDISAQLGSLETPSLVVVGANDFEFFSLDNLRTLIGKNLPAAAYEVLEDASHFPMAETPLRFVRLVEDFMSSHA